MSKVRVLWVGEASFLNTGYSLYARELLGRLYATGKYEIAELACYSDYKNPKLYTIPWRVYSNIPANAEEEREFSSNPVHQFGGWKFEEVVIDFKPDFVIMIRDHWMDSFVETSPLRKYFNWVIMPTVDSAPQQEGWINTYISADAVFTYSTFGKNTLEKESGGKINWIGLAPPCPSNAFKPLSNKTALRKKWGIPDKAKVIGSVMRNQKRKLFPDLIDSFVQLLNSCDNSLASNLYLYLHTSYPDLGWDIPRLIRESGVSNRIILTYICANCGHALSSIFKDVRTVCPRCGQLSMSLPNTRIGLTDEQLCEVYNMFDIYVQYAICLAKDEPILTIDGWKPISSIKAGDKVLSHNSKYQTVKEIIVNPHNDIMKKIHVWSNYNTLTITPEHPVYSIAQCNLRYHSKSLREWLGDLQRLGRDLPELKFVEVNKLQKGDMLAIAIDDTIEDVERIDISLYAIERDTITDNEISVKNGHVYPRYINIDEDFCKFLGLYVANGSVDNFGRMIKVTSNINNIIHHELCNRVMHNLTNKEVTIRKYNNRQAIDQYVCAIPYSRWFLSSCKKHEERQLPNWVLRLPLNKQKAILQGLFMGDGCVSKDGSLKYYTISKTLADQIQYILRRLRIYYNCHLKDRTKDNLRDGKNRRNIYQFEIYVNILENNFDSVRHNSRNIYYKNYYLMKIKDIQDIQYNDFVYNLEVEEDNSYTTHIISVHNCEGYGIPIAEAAACQIPITAVDYSAMSDLIREFKGYPIPVQRFFRESETHTLRAYPDNAVLVETLKKFFNLPPSMQLKRGMDALKGVKKYYNWENVIHQWMNVFDNMPVKNNWNDAPQIVYPKKEFPDPKRFGPDILVNWGIANILNRPDLINSYFAMRMIRDLIYGHTQIQTGGSYITEDSVLGSQPRHRPFTPNDAMEILYNMRMEMNKWESIRVGQTQLPQSSVTTMVKIEE